MNRSKDILFVKETIKKAALFLIMISFPFASFGMEKGMGGKEGGACKGDIEKFCKDVKPGEGGIGRCLKENESQLSGECKQDMSKMKEKMAEKMKENQEACKEDVEKFCKEVQPGEGGMIQCLQKHEEQISAKCKNTLPGKDKERHPDRDR